MDIQRLLKIAQLGNRRQSNARLISSLQLPPSHKHFAQGYGPDGYVVKQADGSVKGAAYLSNTSIPTGRRIASRRGVGRLSIHQQPRFQQILIPVPILESPLFAIVWAFDGYFDYFSDGQKSAIEHGTDSATIFSFPSAIASRMAYVFGYVDPSSNEQYMLAISDRKVSASNSHGLYLNGEISTFDFGVNEQQSFITRYSFNKSNGWFWTHSLPDPILDNQDENYIPGGLVVDLVTGQSAPALELSGNRDLGTPNAPDRSIYRQEGITRIFPNEVLSEYRFLWKLTSTKNSDNIEERAKVEAEYVRPKIADSVNEKAICYEVKGWTIEEDFPVENTLTTTTIDFSSYGAFLHNYSSGQDVKTPITAVAQNNLPVPNTPLASVAVGDSIEISYDSGSGDRSAVIWGALVQNYSFTGAGVEDKDRLIPSIAGRDFRGYEELRTFSFGKFSVEKTHIEKWLQNPGFVWGSLPLESGNLMLVKASVESLNYRPLDRPIVSIGFDGDPYRGAGVWQILDFTISVVETYGEVYPNQAYLPFRDPRILSAVNEGGFLTPDYGSITQANYSLLDHPAHYALFIRTNYFESLQGSDVLTEGSANAYAYHKSYIWNLSTISGIVSPYQSPKSFRQSNVGKPWSRLKEYESGLFIPRFKFVESDGILNLNFDAWEFFKATSSSENPNHPDVDLSNNNDLYPISRLMQ